MANPIHFQQLEGAYPGLANYLVQNPGVLLDELRFFALEEPRWCPGPDLNRQGLAAEGF